MCPNCRETDHFVKKGKYLRPSDQLPVQRFLCRSCGKQFSAQTWEVDYRQRKRDENQKLYSLLNSGVSQRRCALLCGLSQKSVAIRIRRFAEVVKDNLLIVRQEIKVSAPVQFDELETFEHTKCKPITVAIAVTEPQRQILSIQVGSIAAKGRLAAISRAKYGPRPCQRRKVLDRMFSDLAQICPPDTVFKSDESPHYPDRLWRTFPRATHLQFKGRRGAVVGQGELKVGGHDPLFPINHTLASGRDDIKCLARRTWCTTKKMSELENRLNCYLWWHNQRIAGVKVPRIFSLRSERICPGKGSSSKRSLII